MMNCKKINLLWFIVLLSVNISLESPDPSPQPSLLSGMPTLKEVGKFMSTMMKSVGIPMFRKGKRTNGGPGGRYLPPNGLHNGVKSFQSYGTGHHTKGYNTESYSPAGGGHKDIDLIQGGYNKENYNPQSVEHITSNQGHNFVRHKDGVISSSHSIEHIINNEGYKSSFNNGKKNLRLKQKSKEKEHFEGHSSTLHGHSYIKQSQHGKDVYIKVRGPTGIEDILADKENPHLKQNLENNFELKGNEPEQYRHYIGIRKQKGGMHPQYEEIAPTHFREGHALLNDNLEDSLEVFNPHDEESFIKNMKQKQKDKSYFGRDLKLRAGEFPQTSGYGPVKEDDKFRGSKVKVNDHGKFPKPLGNVHHGKTRKERTKQAFKWNRGKQTLRNEENSHYRDGKYFLLSGRENFREQNHSDGWKGFQDVYQSLPHSDEVFKSGYESRHHVTKIRDKKEINERNHGDHDDHFSPLHFRKENLKTSFAVIHL